MCLIFSNLDSNSTTMLQMQKKIDRMDWLCRFEDYCPWLQMTVTSRSRSRNLRERVFNKLGLTAATATCWVTGKHVAVKNAHILPDSTNTKVMRRLQLEPYFKNDVNAIPSNFMILDSHLENAFDSMKISFSPADQLHTEVLLLKIWDPTCRDDPVGVGTTAEMQKDIKDYGKQLTTSIMARIMAVLVEHQRG